MVMQEEKRLTVAMISTFFCRCGIATYSQALIKALTPLDVDVYGVKLPRLGVKTPEILRSVVDAVPLKKIDLIHVQEEYGLYQGLEGGFYGSLKRLGKPIVSTVHATGAWEIDNVISDTSDRVIVHNHFCARRFGHPCTIIPHGVNPVEAQPKEASKNSYGIDPRAFIVGYLGFISQNKGLEMLIEAVGKTTNVGLLIGGGWHTEAENGYIFNLKNRALQVLPGKCQWLGYVPEDQLATAYGAMDIIVYPSRFASESGALLMAVGYGKAVIATNIEPFREKAEQKVIWTFSDVDDLAEKIQRLQSNVEERTALEAKAREYAFENRWEVIAQKHVELYRNVISEHQKIEGSLKDEPDLTRKQ